MRCFGNWISTHVIAGCIEINSPLQRPQHRITCSYNPLILGHLLQSMAERIKHSIAIHIHLIDGMIESTGLNHSIPICIIADQV